MEDERVGRLHRDGHVPGVHRRLPEPGRRPDQLPRDRRDHHLLVQGSPGCLPGQESAAVVLHGGSTRHAEVTFY